MLKNIWFFFKNLRKLIGSVVSILGVLIGGGAILLTVFAEEFVTAIFGISEATFAKSAMLMLGLSLFIIVLIVAVWAVIFSRDRNKEIVRAINEHPQVCQEIQSHLSEIQITATHLKSVLAENELAKSVISGSAVDDMEASVQKDKRIIIFTSKFILEGYGEFTKVIIRNFRKGVKYEYYVPNDERGALVSYWSRVKEWYGEFAVFTRSKQDVENLLALAQNDESVGHAWSNEYIDLIQKCLGAYSKRASQRKHIINQVKQRLRSMFVNQLKSYALDANLFYVTVAMYEKEGGAWRAILKLPTENPQENYVVFSLDNANVQEKESFVSNILHLPNGNSPLAIAPDIFTDLGGNS